MDKFILVAPSGEIMQWQDRSLLNYSEAPEGMTEIEVSDDQFAEAKLPAWFSGGEIVFLDPAKGEEK